MFRRSYSHTTPAMVGVLVHALVSASLQAPPPPLVLVFALACEPLAGGASDGVALVQSLVQVLAGTCAAKHYHATLKKRPWRANLDKQARNGWFGVDAPRAGLAEQPSAELDEQGRNRRFGVDAKHAALASQPCQATLTSKPAASSSGLMHCMQPFPSSLVEQP